MSEIKGYKVFNSDWTCRGFQYEVGKVFEENVKPKCGERGFHFCEKAVDCFNYYRFNPAFKVAEVIALGEVDIRDGLGCTNKIQIVREIPWTEVLNIVNIGLSNTGLRNTGNWNTGNRNTGDCNTGDRNTGDCNTGDCNTGHRNTGNWNTGHRNTGDRNTGHRNTGHRNTGNWNTGNWNTGDRNTGDCNTGDRNTGHRNTGDRNTGHRNTGHRNTGHRNTGDCNTGDRNTGHRNTGDRNTGHWNTGDRNTGNWNTGDWNTGDWNKSSFNTGCFNTEEQKIMLFNKPSDMTYNDWLRSDARYLLNQIPKDVIEWVYEEDMTDEEKAANPTYETTGGYLKTITVTNTEKQEWWDSLKENEKECVKALPNFDASIFYECTGIEV